MYIKQEMMQSCASTISDCTFSLQLCLLQEKFLHENCHPYMLITRGQGRNTACRSEAVFPMCSFSSEQQAGNEHMPSSEKFSMIVLGKIAASSFLLLPTLCLCFIFLTSTGYHESFFHCLYHSTIDFLFTCVHQDVKLHMTQSKVVKDKHFRD